MTILEALKRGRIDEAHFHVREGLEPAVTYDQLAAELHVAGPPDLIEKLWAAAEAALESKSVKG